MDQTAGGVIWDVDGTLVDTAEMHFAAWTELCRQRNLPFSRASFVATFGMRNPEVLRELFGDRFDRKAMDELGTSKEALYREALRAQGVALLPGARQLLEELQRASFVQALGSSAPRENIDLIVEQTGTGQFFKAITAMEDTERGKPDPQVFLIAAGRVGMPATRCVVIEDAVAGIQAAKAGGMRAVAVTFVGHHPDAKLRAAGADLVIPTLEALNAAKVAELLT